MLITILRWCATLFFVVSGSMHFVTPEFFRAMMPPFIPFPDFFIVLTGLAEMAGAVGIQIPRVRKLSGILMIIMLVSIFPANIYVAMAQPDLPGLDYSPSSMWWRLLLQPLFIVWMWFVAVKKQAVKPAG